MQTGSWDFQSCLASSLQRSVVGLTPTDRSAPGTRRPPAPGRFCFPPTTAQDSGISILIASHVSLDRGPTGSRNERQNDCSADLSSRWSNGGRSFALRPNQRSKRCCSEVALLVGRAPADTRASCMHARPQRKVTFKSWREKEEFAAPSSETQVSEKTLNQ